MVSEARDHLRSDRASLWLRLHGFRASPPIIPHSPPDVKVSEDVDDDDARAYDVPRDPAERQPSPASVGAEVAVMAHVFVTIAVDEGQTCGQHGIQIKDQVGKLSIWVQARPRPKDVHGRVQGDQQDSNVGGLDADGEGKAAELAKGRVGRDAAPAKADNGKDDEDDGLEEVALDQQQDQPGMC